MERRDFLKTSCSLCVGISAGILLSQLSACSSLPLYKAERNGDSIEVPLSLFSNIDLYIIRPKNYEYDIALQKHNDGSYAAFLLRCTHAATKLQFIGNNFYCNLHGSTFDEHGAVTRGPAEYPLTKLKARVVNDIIQIELS